VTGTGNASLAVGSTLPNGALSRSARAQRTRCTELHLSHAQRRIQRPRNEYSRLL
jgi:hypothetical protein